MPPKKAKDLASSPVYGMPHDQQVQLLSDALLREYMHRRGYLATLKAFDEENPRTEETISSRALMSELMALPTDDQQRMKTEGIETIMEMLCNLRVERRQKVEELTAQANEEIPDVPAEYVALKEKHDRKKREKKAKRAKKKGKKSKKSGGEESSSGSSDSEDRGREGSADEEGGEDDMDADRSEYRAGKDATAKKTGRKSEGKRKKASKKEKANHRSSSAVDDDADDAEGDGGGGGMTFDDLLGSTSSSSSGSNNNARPHEDANDHKVEEGNGRQTLATSPSGKQAFSSSSSPQEEGPRTGAHSSSSPPPPPPLSGAGEATTINTAVPPKSSPGSGGVHTTEEEEAEAYTPLEGSAPLGEEDAMAALNTLFGHAAPSPPLSFLQQGFCFEEGLEYALLQWKRGPAAVVAPVQALVVGFMYEKASYVGVEVRQRDCLRRALLTILSRAQSDPQQMVLVDGALSLRDSRQSFAHQLSSRFHVWRGFVTLREVEDQLRTLVEARWMAPKGTGLWCFLLSLVLSRGGAAIEKDMAAPAHPLIRANSGEGTLELANLCLTGKAVSYTHDGTVQRPGQPGQRGYGPGTLLCGFLDGDLASRPSDDDDSGGVTRNIAVNSSLPSWVVHHRGQFANLFMKKDSRKVFEQKRALGGSASVELVYWDALTEDDEVPLTVTVSGGVVAGWAAGGGGGGRRRNAASFVNTAILSVPAWSNGEIDWGDVAPLRDER